MDYFCTVIVPGSQIIVAQSKLCSIHLTHKREARRGMQADKPELAQNLLYLNPVTNGGHGSKQQIHGQRRPPPATTAGWWAPFFYALN